MEEWNTKALKNWIFLDFSELKWDKSISIVEHNYEFFFSTKIYNLFTNKAALGLLNENFFLFFS